MILTSKEIIPTLKITTKKIIIIYLKYLLIKKLLVIKYFSSKI